MAEINRQDIITDDALAAIEVLSKNLEGAVGSLDKFLQKSREVKDLTAAGGTSMKKLAKETDTVSEANKELAKVQQQIATTIAKNNEGYVKSQQELANVKKELKDKIALTGQDNLAVTAANSSTEKLGKALKANQAAYAALRDETARNSTEGKNLLSVIQEQDAAFKTLRSSTGLNQDSVGDYSIALKNLKAELKQARGEMVSVAETLGQSSPQYQAAAKRAGEIADKIGDAKDEAKAFQGDTAVENLGTRFGLLGDKVRALDFKGAGVQLQGIADLSKGLTFKEMTSGLSGVTTALGGMAKAIFTNPIFILAAVVAGVVIAFNYYEEQAEKISKNTIKRADNEIKKLTDRYDHEIRLKKIAGEATFDLEREKQEAIITTAEKGIKAAEDFTSVDILQSVLQLKVVLEYNEEKIKSLTEFTDKRREAVQEIEALNAQEAKDDLDKLKKIAEERKKKADEEKKLRDEQEDAQAIAAHQKEVKAIQELNSILENYEKRQEKEAVFQASLRNEEEQSSEEFIEWQKKRGTAELRRADDAKIFEEERKVRQKQEVEDLQLLASVYAAAFSSLTSILSSFDQSDIERSNLAIARIKERSAIDLQIAGNDTELKEQIQKTTDARIEKLEKEKRKKQREVAEREKIAALIDAGIRTSLAVLLQLAGGDPFSAIPRSIAAGAIGAFQIAAIAAKPIPEFEKGVRNFGGGHAIVGESGIELLENQGRMMLTDNKATLMKLSPGTNVIPHDETMKRLALAAVKGVSSNGGRTEEATQLSKVIEKGNKDLAAVISVSQGNVFRQGTLAYQYQKDLEGNKKMIRLKSFSE